VVIMADIMAAYGHIRPEIGSLPPFSAKKV
jgi:hypothetical protein